MPTSPRIVSIALALSMMVLALPSLDAAEGTSEAPIGFAGVVTLHGSDAGTIALHLSAEAELSTLWIDPSTTVTGNGRATGFALVTAPDGSHPEGRFVVRNRMTWCAEPACVPLGDLVGCGCDAWFETSSQGFDLRTYNGPEGIDLRVVLPPGDYALYLLADGAPVTARFPLYMPNTATPHPGHLALDVPSRPDAVRLFADLNDARASGPWEAGANMDAGTGRVHWSASAWELTRDAGRFVGGPFAYCDYPGGRTILSSPCPVTAEYWLERGTVAWRAMSPMGVSIATTRDTIPAGGAYGIWAASTIVAEGPVDRGMLVVELR